MPYIVQGQRKLLDPIIGQFGAVVGGSWEGALNYIITKLCLMYWQGDPTYAGIATITGVLENVKSEFYRKVAVPYEDRKAEVNGDVFVQNLDGQTFS